MNPFLVGQKVLTKFKGNEVEVEVTGIFNDEAQVRTPDGLRRWRTVRTVRSIETTNADPVVVDVPTDNTPSDSSRLEPEPLAPALVEVPPETQPEQPIAPTSCADPDPIKPGKKRKKHRRR